MNGKDSEYIKKNTVPSTNQTPRGGVIYYNDEDINAPLKITFIGNSITKHGVKEEIGWFGNWGMAASSEENDYVHKTMARVREEYPKAAFCIIQGSSWERDYKNEEVVKNFEAAKAFKPHIVVMRLGENVPGKDFDDEVFYHSFINFCEYMGENATVIATSCFWGRALDDLYRKAAKEKGYDFVETDDLGRDKSNMAIGLFKHEGVAAHPGDKGMQLIADRIAEKILEIKKRS